VGIHAVVDFFSFISVSLLPLLQTRLDLTDSQIATLLSVGAVTSGACQPVVAWISDKLDTRILGVVGFFVAVVCIANIGHAQTFTQLLLLHGLGAMGVGAFHPPAAAVVGQLSGTRRALGMSVFFLLGMVGGMAGNIFTPQIVAFFSGVSDVDVLASGAETVSSRDIGEGLRSLSWLMIPGLMCVAVLALATLRVGHRDQAAHDHHTTLTAVQRKARWGAVGILYVANVIRFSVNLALIYLFAKWAEAHVLAKANAFTMTEALSVEASKLNGPLQAMMQAGMGGFGLLLGFMLGARHEKLAFIVIPIFGAATIASIPFIPAGSGGAVWLAMGVSVLTGVGFGSLIPVSMACAQRLIPHRTSLASGLMLGGAWTFSFIGPRIAETVHHAISLNAAFWVVSGAMLLASSLGILLPGKLLASSAAPR
jgi:FSR family fosmidomycin resistance protein-like MFS transporter